MIAPEDAGLATGRRFSLLRPLRRQAVTAMRMLLYCQLMSIIIEIIMHTATANGCELLYI
ncbi:hypothetical protein SD70_18535 [Gordoniibacillus kamchatkensis]|uniref:Uncharacterized protein n=1 Tax=Gordoniibacillus kamchatkensis TaxID=1590651 RepID=A0ABR5AF68_9BACL|nr:hypothetical protein SD70_18535 [Paenibacillus sp. VKM B-2647]